MNLVCIKIMHCIFLLAFMIQNSMATFESSLSQKCYSDCPHKTRTIESKSRQDQDREWFQCLKDCHKMNEWRFMILFGCFIILIVLVFIIIYIYCGENIKKKYIFYVQKKKRHAILQAESHHIQDFKKIMIQPKKIGIQFQNDNDHKKQFLIKDAVFDIRRNSELEQRFIINIAYKQKKIEGKQDNTIQQLTQVTTVQQKQQNSQLIGSIVLTVKGINLWWIKIDEKSKAQKIKCCFCFSRKYQKYYSVYEGDPFAPQDSFIGNVVLQDSTKLPQNRYTKYLIKEIQPLSHINESIIQT